MTDLGTFLRELRADPRTAAAADTFTKALNALDIEGDGNPDAAGMLEAIDAVVREPLPFADKLAALDRLINADRIILIRGNTR